MYRLINDTSQNYNMEQNLKEKLKKESSVHLGKIEKMFQDI